MGRSKCQLGRPRRRFGMQASSNTNLELETHFEAENLDLVQRQLDRRLRDNNRSAESAPIEEEAEASIKRRTSLVELFSQCQRRGPMLIHVPPGARQRLIVSRYCMTENGEDCVSARVL